MIPESRMKEYKDCMTFAQGLAKTHDKKFYVYDMEYDGKNVYQATPERVLTDDGEDERANAPKLVGECFPGGRALAWGLFCGGTTKR